MNINIGVYYETKLRRIMDRGVAANKTEALRMAVTAFEQQLKEEEERMVLEKLRQESAGLKNAKFKSFDEVLKANKIDRKSL